MYRNRTEKVDAARRAVSKLASPVTIERVEARSCLKKLSARIVEAALFEALPGEGGHRTEMLRLCNELRITARLLRRLRFCGCHARQQAFERLSQLRDARCVPQLIRYWARVRDYRPELCELLTGIDAPDLIDVAWEHARHSERVRVRLGELMRCLGAAGTERLLDRLSHGAPEERNWVFELVSICRDASVLARFVERCSDTGTRIKLIRALAALGDENSLLELMRLVRFAADWGTRLAAVRALLRRKEPQALAFLGELMHDREWLQELRLCMGGDAPADWTWRSAFDTLLAACGSDARRID